MSATVDANALLYASDRASRFHAPAQAHLGRLAQGPGLLHLFWPVLMAYLRIATHPSIFEEPLSPDDAMSNVDALLELPHARAHGEGPRFWTTYRAACAPVVVRGNLVPDAHLVALMHEHGVRTVWSHDRDLRKFESIEVRDPFA